MKLTSKKIAEKAGVSRGTVDRVLHNRGRVKPETAEKIRKIIAENNYQPDAFGSNLARRQERVIGVLLLDPENPFFQVMKKGADDAVSQYKDYKIVLKMKNIEGGNEESYLTALNELQENTDALAIVGYNTPKIIQEVNKLCNKIPLNTMNTDMPDSDRIGFLGIDDFRAGQCVGLLTKEILPSGGNVFLMSGRKEIKPQEKRVEGFLDYTKQYTDLNISKVVYSGDHADIVYEETANAFIRHKYDGAVLMGAYLNAFTKAIDDLNLSYRPKIIGFDLIDANRKLLEDGKADFVIGQQGYFQAFNTIHSLCEYLIHKTPLSEGIHLLPITINNHYNI